MIKAYKTEINPNIKQISLINSTIGTCRYVYNLYIEKSREYYRSHSTFLSGYDFSKWLNNEHSKKEEFKWIKDSSSKAIKQSIMNADNAYRRYFKKITAAPKYKKKKRLWIFLPHWNNLCSASLHSATYTGKS